MSYFVYMLRCSDDTLYIGSTPDLEKRIDTHNNGKNGARYTRGRRPVVLVYVEELASKGEALSREHALKKYTRAQKLKLISTYRK